MSALVASDLDRTLIYSSAAAAGHDADGRDLVAVERYQGADASWMTARAAATFAALPPEAVVLPVTTRTPDQWRRITLPGPPPRYVITANGGILLVDDEPDQRWRAVVDQQLGRAARLDEVWRHAGAVCHPEWTKALRNVEGLFCYAVLDRARLPAGFVAEEAAWADARGWQVSLQGRKLYWVPRELTKSAAVAEVARRVGASAVYAAGDSLLDADLLEAADAGIAARHGELVASGWRAAHVTITQASGVLAGAEIVDWLAAAASAGVVSACGGGVGR